MQASREQQELPVKVATVHQGHTMFRMNAPRTRTQTAFGMMELIFHASVRSVRKSNGNAIAGLLKNIFQTILLIAVFFFMFDVLGMRGNAIRGDYILFIMSGVFMFMAT